MRCLTLGASGTTYTAPADGWVTILGFQAGSNGWVAIYTGRLKSFQQAVNTNNFYLAGFLPVKSGAKYIIDYSDFRVDHFNFYYAVGSEPIA